MAPSDSSEIPAATRTLGDKGLWPDNVKKLCTLMLSKCSSATNHGFPVLLWMARACPERVTAGAAMSDHELADWNNPAKHTDVLPQYCTYSILRYCTYIILYYSISLSYGSYYRLVSL